MNATSQWEVIAFLFLIFLVMLWLLRGKDAKPAMVFQSLLLTTSSTNNMLPKDLLKYARLFSPKEIEEAIVRTVKNIGKEHVPQRALTYSEWLDIEFARQVAQSRIMAPLPQPLPNTWQSDPIYTTTTTNLFANNPYYTASTYST